MGTTIDSLQIEIQTGSSNAAGGIDNLAKSLERLKKVGSFNVVIKNLNNLSSALDKLQNSSSGLVKLNLLASSIESLKKAGSFGSVATSFAKLGTALKDLEKINIDGAVAKIKELNDKLGPVSDKLVAIGNAFKNVNSNANKASGGFSIFGGKVNTTAMNMANLIQVFKAMKQVLKKIVELLKYCIGEAIEWEGVAQRFGRGFGESADEVYTWVKRLNKEMGINTQQFMQYSSTYATMLTGFGVASKDASKMALGYMELTYDIWSGYNDIYKSLDDAATAVRSAIAGEVEPVRKAGFTIIESTLEQTAANHGLKISLEKATEAQKSYLRYLTLVDQATAQGLIGNYAREMNTAEGVMRTFTQQLKSLAQTFGSIFLPILVKVMPWLQAFVELLGEAIMEVANFFGVDVQKVDFGSSISGSADSATESVNDTTEALKNLKNATTGIDELNIISPQSESGGGSSSGSGAGFTGIDVDSLWSESIFDQIQFDVEAIKSKLKEALPSIESLLGVFSLAFGTILVVSGANIPAGLGLMALGVAGVSHGSANWDATPAKLREAISAAEAIAGVGFLAIGAILAFSGANVPLGIGLLTVGAISLTSAVAINWDSIVNSVAYVLERLGVIIGGALLALGVILLCTGVATPLGIALVAVGAASLVAGVVLNWNFIINSIKEFFKKIGIILGGSLLAIGILLCLTGVGLPLGIGLVVAGASSLVAGVALNWDTFTEIGKNCVDGIINGFSELGNKVKEVFGAFVKAVKDFLGIKSPSKVFGEIGNFCLQGLTNALKPGALKDALSTMWSNAKSWWSKNVKLSIPSLSLRVVYTEATGWKKSIVDALGLQGWPSLSFAANGGIFDTGSLVWAGEAGPEIVANAGGGKTGVMNVQQMSEAVYEGVYSAVVAAMRASNGNGGSQSVNVYLDGKQITASVEQRQKERGASLMGSQVYAY